MRMHSATKQCHSRLSAVHRTPGQPLLRLPAGVYLPMICELPIAMLACARIGAMHTVVFAGFSAEALSQRLVDCK